MNRRKVTEDVKSTMLAMRANGATYLCIANTVGLSKSTVFQLLKTDFASACKYVCRNCGNPTKSARKLCSKTDCRKIYAREVAREKWNLRTYGLTDETLATMRAAQDNKCPICKRGLHTTKMVVDHDHETGEVRGLLCHRCNIGLGMLNESADLLRAAANYIEEAKCQQALIRTT